MVPAAVPNHRRTSRERRSAGDRVSKRPGPPRDFLLTTWMKIERVCSSAVGDRDGRDSQAIE